MIPMVTDVVLALDWAARAPVISAMSFVSVAFMIHPLCPPTLRLFRAEHLDGGDAFRAAAWRAFLNQFVSAATLS
jgi:hypothetical protein